MSECEKLSTCEFCRDFIECKIDHQKHNEWAIRNRMAKIEKYNIVKVSSILPPDAKVVAREKALKELKPSTPDLANKLSQATTQLRP